MFYINAQWHLMLVLKDYKMKKIAKTAAIIAGTISMLGANQVFAQNANCCSQPSPSVLNINASADLKQSPDIAIISAGVVTQSRNAKTAMSDNANKMAAAFAAIKAAGIADRDMQTSGISLQPQYVYEENKPPRITGYQASNNLTVRIRQMDKVGAVLDAVVAQGINQISGPSFSIDNPDAALDKAREEAMQTAMRRANIYARASGMKIKRVVSINESGGYQQPQPMPMMAMARMEKADAMTPVAGGEVTMSIQLNVQFELEK